MTADSRSQSISWYRSPVDRDVLQRLHRRSDFKGLLQAGGHLALITLTGTVAWYFQDRPLLLITALFVHGTFYVFLLNATHELCHGTVFKSHFLNRFFLRFFSFLCWRDHVVIHGQQDELIPFAHGLRLFDAGKGRRFFLEVAGGHGNWFDHSQLPYERELNDFMMAIGLAG